MVESTVHFPTDINLLWDALRCSLRSIGQLGESYQITDWRQWKYQTKQVKKAFRLTQKIKHSTSKNAAKREGQQEKILAAHRDYIVLASGFLARIEATIANIPKMKKDPAISALHRWIRHGYHQVNLIRRRVLEGEKIPHEDKIFSIFEPYSEWISKGKAGVPVELGLKVCVMESEHGFILHHQVMRHQTDCAIAVEITQATKALYPQLTGCSYDKGFHSPANQTQLPTIIDEVVLPKKGRWSKADKARETAPEFVKKRRHHSAVESGINALEIHGLDRCPDKGLDHFKRYVGLAVVARNLQKLGAILQERALKKLQREEARRRRQAA